MSIQRYSPRNFFPSLNVYFPTKLYSSSDLSFLLLLSLYPSHYPPVGSAVNQGTLRQSASDLVEKLEPLRLAVAEDNKESEIDDDAF